MEGGRCSTTGTYVTPFNWVRDGVLWCMQFIDDTTKQKPLPLLGDLGEVACGSNPVLRRLRQRWAGPKPKPVLVLGPATQA